MTTKQRIQKLTNATERALNYHIKERCVCDFIAEQLLEICDFFISFVTWQNSDGYCAVVEQDGVAPLNIPVFNILCTFNKKGDKVSIPEIYGVKEV